MIPLQESPKIKRNRVIEKKVMISEYHGEIHRLGGIKRIVRDQLKHGGCGIGRILHFGISNIAAQHNLLERLHRPDDVGLTRGIGTVNNCRAQGLMIISPDLLCEDTVVQPFLLRGNSHGEHAFIFEGFIVLHPEFQQHRHTSILQVYCKTIFYIYRYSPYLSNKIIMLA